MTDLARDYEQVLRAIRALGSAWAGGRPPTTTDVLVVGVDASTSLARLAVAAGVKPEEIRLRGKDVLR